MQPTNSNYGSSMQGQMPNMIAEAHDLPDVENGDTHILNRLVSSEAPLFGTQTDRHKQKRRLAIFFGSLSIAALGVGGTAAYFEFSGQKNAPAIVQQVLEAKNVTTEVAVPPVQSAEMSGLVSAPSPLQTDSAAQINDLHVQEASAGPLAAVAVKTTPAPVVSPLAALDAKPRPSDLRSAHGVHAAGRQHAGTGKDSRAGTVRMTKDKGHALAVASNAPRVQAKARKTEVKVAAGSKKTDRTVQHIAQNKQDSDVDLIEMLARYAPSAKVQTTRQPGVATGDLAAVLAEPSHSAPLGRR